MTHGGLEVRVDIDPPAVEAAVDRLIEDRVASRLFSRDATLWGPEAESEASIRLGWVDSFDRVGGLLDEVAALREEFRAQGVDRVVLCGMGGSSLAPEVIARRDAVPLTVLDSTHPASVRRALSGDLARTAVVVSSKSGSTVETRSHLAAFEHRFGEAGIDPASRIVIVTDPGSPLEASARAAGYRVFLADPNVGGRFSALTAFGIVPVALAGAAVSAVLEEARSVAPALARDEPANPALRLAAALAAGLPARYACALREAGADAIGLGDWIEQLVAESTGKGGRGVLPLALPDDAPESNGGMPAEALPVALLPEGTIAPPAPIAVIAPLGAQFLLWEVATAVLCRLIGVNPFDQPDVESAKSAARSAMEPGLSDPRPIAVLPGGGGIEVLAAPGAAPEDIGAALRELSGSLTEGGYLAIQAYLDRETWGDEVRGLRNRLAETIGAPVTLGWGPRYLHSTGQLHKGGPAIGIFLQLLDVPALDEPVPDGPAGFGALIAAQARGDREVLAARGRPVLALRASDPGAMLKMVAGALD